MTKSMHNWRQFNNKRSSSKATASIISKAEPSISTASPSTKPSCATRYAAKRTVLCSLCDNDGELTLARGLQLPPSPAATTENDSEPEGKNADAKDDT